MQRDDRRVRRREDLRARADARAFDTFDWNLFGQSGSLSFTSGVLLWPFVFLMTDVINEYFGRRGVRFISWLTVVLISYGFLAAYLAISLVPAQFWVAVNAEARRAGHAGRVRQHLRAGDVDDRRLDHRVPGRAADRRRHLPPHPHADRRALGVAARDRLDRRLAAHRQLRRALHRLRDRPAALADTAVPRGRHRELRLQAADGVPADPADLSHAARDPRRISARRRQQRSKKRRGKV